MEDNESDDDSAEFVAEIDELTWRLIHSLATGKQTPGQASEIIAQIAALQAGHLALLTLTGHGAILLQRLAEATGRTVDEAAADMVDLNTFAAIVGDVEDPEDEEGDG